MSAEVDLSQLNALVHDLTQAGTVAGAEARKVVAKGGLNIKNDWREGWAGMAHAPLLPLSIGYDVNVSASGIEAEIGPDKDKAQGALGNLLEFGSVNNPPNPAGQKALDREEPRFVQALENIVGKIL
jgi:hypothetical protein